MARGKAANTPASIEPEEESQEVTEGEPEAATRPEGKVSKSHAARVALSQGYENPSKAVKFIKQRFGIDMGAQHFSSIKSQMKLKGETPVARGQARVRGERPVATDPETAGPGTTPPSTESMDLMDDLSSVKALVRKLGVEQVRKIVDLFD